MAAPAALATRYSAEALKAKAQELVALYSDLEAVQATLTSLPQSLKHKVVVPVGKVAFTRGTLERTNEVMVNLGAGMFSKQSAFQACGVLERRKTTVQADIRAIKEALAAQAGGASSGRPKGNSSSSSSRSQGENAAKSSAGGPRLTKDPKGFVEVHETLEEAEALSREARPVTSPAPRALTEEERSRSRAIWDQFAKLEEENDPEALAAAEAALAAQEERERAEAEMSMDEFYNTFLNQNRRAEPEASDQGSVAVKAAGPSEVDNHDSKAHNAAFSGEILERPAPPPSAPASLSAPTAADANPPATSTDDSASAKPKRVSLFKKNLAAKKA